MPTIPAFTSSVFMLSGMYGTKRIGLVDVDAFIRESHRMTAEVTEYPVEEGDEISDHVIQKPNELDVDGIIGTNNLFIPVPLPSDFTRAYDGYQDLLAAKEAGEPISVVTGLTVYDQMIIVDFTIDRDKDNGRSLEFKMSLKHVKIVQSQTTTMPKTQATKQAAVKKDAGNEGGNNVDPGNALFNQAGSILGAP
jgi:hypothetical protein